MAESEATKRYERGIEHAKNGEYRRSVDELTVAIELAPKDKRIYIDRSKSQAQLGGFRQAINDLNVAIKFDAKNAAVFHARGLYYAQLGEHEHAVDDFTAAIKLQQKDANVYNSRGISYAALVKHIYAIGDYDIAIELNPKDARIYNNRGNSYGAIGKHQNAIDDFTKAIALDPKHAPAYVSRSISNIQLEEFPEEIQEDFMRGKSDPILDQFEVVIKSAIRLKALKEKRDQASSRVVRNVFMTFFAVTILFSGSGESTPSIALLISAVFAFFLVRAIMNSHNLQEEINEAQALLNRDKAERGLNVNLYTTDN